MTLRSCFLPALMLLLWACGTSQPYRGNSNVVLQQTYAACPDAGDCADGGLCRTVLLDAGTPRLCVTADVCTHASCEAQMGATSCTLTSDTVSCPPGPL